MEIFWKGIGHAELRAICPKLCGNCTFLQNFHTRKIDEISEFYAVQYLESIYIKCFKIYQL